MRTAAQGNGVRPTSSCGSAAAPGRTIGRFPSPPWRRSLPPAPRLLSQWTTIAGGRQIRAYGTMGDLFLLGEGAQTVLDRLPPGRRIAFAFEDAEGTAWRTSFSLSGLIAALLWIDERQQQLGLRRIAGASPIGVDPAVPDPIDDEASYGDLPPALLTFIDADPECRPFVDLANGADIEVDPDFGPDRKLYILPCWSAAYNFGWKVFLEDSGKISLVALPEYSLDTGWTATTHIVNYWYDPDTRELHSFSKGRGRGDCGSTGLWRWHKYGFRLIEFANKECDTEGARANFPVVYELKE